jgi:hypothetical protein
MSLPRELEVEALDKPVLVVALAESFKRFGELLEGS